jgi:cytolysin-activating lysine-acyltransferase
VITPMGASVPDKMIVLGELVYLMSCSNLHRRFTVEQIALQMLPSIARGNFRVYRKKAGPVGFVTWTGLNEEASARFAAGHSLKPEQLDSGNDIWVLDFLAPFGHIPPMIEDLRKNVFRNATRVRAMRRNDQGVVVRVLDFRRSSGGTRIQLQGAENPPDGG